MTSLAAALICALVYLDSWPIGQFMLGRPALLLPLLGILLGMPLESLWLGLVLELALIRTLPMGSTLPPDPALGGVWTLFMAWLARERGLLSAELDLGGQVAFLLLAGLLLSWLAPWLTELQRRINGRYWRPRFETAVQDGDSTTCNRLMPLALLQTFLLALALSWVVLELGVLLLGSAESLILRLASSASSNWIALPPLLFVLAWGGLWQHSAGRKGRRPFYLGLLCGSALVLLLLAIGGAS